MQELRDDAAFAREYLAAALAEADEPSGREALLLVLRQLASSASAPLAAVTTDRRP